jgi:cysteinyl-tRNA synthetase
MHNAWVTMSGEKMSKSLGNGLLVSQMVKQWRPVELRYYLGTPHYRSTIDFSEAALGDAALAYRRIETFVTNAHSALGHPPDLAMLPKEFVDAMNDDFGVPAAVAVIHSSVRAGNTAMKDGDLVALDTALGEVLAMTAVLGLNPMDWAQDESHELTAVVDALAGSVIAEREQARARKDFETADKLRDLLVRAGIEVEDTATGARWSLTRGGS